MEEQKTQVITDRLVSESDSVVKILFAIMNEEEDIDAYYDKTPEEMADIIKLCDARYPDKKMASYDPLFTKFGQIFLNGYNTFGVDFIKLLVKRTDETPNLCYKGLFDVYMNQVIENEELTSVIKSVLQDIVDGNIDKVTDLAKSVLKNAEESAEEVTNEVSDSEE